jgi:hypothetical protein
MVRAILAGTKGQTRRVVTHRDEVSTHQCPYGSPGDHLWVRETFAAGLGLAEVSERSQAIAMPGARRAPAVVYGADGAQLPSGCHWRPSIFMPRSASRLTLEIRETRVERLQEINELDARSEGVDSSSGSSIHPFSILWDAINGARSACSWASNPLVHVVHVVRFEVVAQSAGGAR